ncbi:MAG: serine--tRNA ligase, partial [Acidimicrobiales bacterium]
MIDLRLLRTSPDAVRAALARRGDAGHGALLDELQALDAQRRALQAELDGLNAERNAGAKTDAEQVKARGALPPDVVAQRKALGGRIAEAEGALRMAEAALEAKALYIPNPPLADVPEGDESCR